MPLANSVFLESIRVVREIRVQQLQLQLAARSQSAAQRPPTPCPWFPCRDAFRPCYPCPPQRMPFGTHHEMHPRLCQ